MFRTSDLLDLMNAGARLELYAEFYSLQDILELADCAAKERTKIVFSLRNTKCSMDHLCKIANRGQGYVVFKDIN